MCIIKKKKQNLQKFAKIVTYLSVFIAAWVKIFFLFSIFSELETCLLPKTFCLAFGKKYTVTRKEIMIFLLKRVYEN